MLFRSSRARVPELDTAPDAPRQPEPSAAGCSYRASKVGQIADGATHIGQANHIQRGPVERHENIVLKNRVRDVDVECLLEQPKAKLDRTVRATEGKEVYEIEYLTPLAQLGLASDRMDVFRAKHEEAAVALRPDMLKQPLLEPEHHMPVQIAVT